MIFPPRWLHRIWLLYPLPETGFCRIFQGPDIGAYYHPLFLRGMQSLSANIVRVKIKGRGHKALKAYDSEPNFYDLPPLLTVGGCVNIHEGVGSGGRSDGGSSFNFGSQPISPQPQAPVFRDPIEASNPPCSPLNPPPSSGQPIMSHTNDLPRTVSLEPDERQECPSRMSSDHSRMSSDHSRTSSEGGASSWGGSSVDDVTALHQQSGYINELAMVCATLCNLRNGTSGWSQQQR